MIDDIEGKCYYRQERMQQRWMSDTGYFPQKNYTEIATNKKYTRKFCIRIKV